MSSLVLNVKMLFLPSDHIIGCAAKMIISFVLNSLSFSLPRKPYKTHEVKGSWEKMPGNGCIWVIIGWAGERGNRYFRCWMNLTYLPSPCGEILVHSWMNSCLWRIVAVQHWQLMQHDVLFSSLWPCIRNLKKYKINKWRIQNMPQRPDVVATVWLL